MIPKRAKRDTSSFVDLGLGLFATADAYNWILVEKKVAETSGQERFANLGYFKSLSALLNEAVNVILRRGVCEGAAPELNVLREGAAEIAALFREVDISAVENLRK